MVGALADRYPVRRMLKAVGLKESTYYNWVSRPKDDPYAEIRPKVVEAFKPNYSCYGYRRVKAIVEGMMKRTVSEKIARRIIKEEGLSPYRKDKAKYSSYKGETSEAPANLMDRDFFANAPYVKVLAGITEFGLPKGKVYLSPIIDCFTGCPVIPRLS